jgi:threonyl-tRNA synthetase
LKKLAEDRGIEFFIEKGEAAIYGPKIDFLAKDSLKREHQVATVQLDRNLPEKFDLSFINKDGEKEKPVMLHVAIAGSLERFSAVMIESTGGNFPFRFSPVQAKVIPVGDFANDYAENIFNKLKENFRVEFDDSNNGFGKKVREAKKQKLPYFIIIGEKDMEEKKVTLESRDSGESKQISIEELVNIFEEENK